jgi:RNA polymerase sigma-70 factor, ECF subfamily
MGVQSDEALVREVIAGHLAAFTELMRRYERRVFRLVRSILHDDDVAEDACQDVWLRAHAELAMLRSTTVFSTWVCRIALRYALARLPEHRGLASLHGLDRDVPDVGDDEAGEPSHGPATTLEAVERTIDAMRRSYSTAVVLRYAEGLTSRETAEVLGLGEANVDMRLARARGWLRDRLGDELGDGMRDVFRGAPERVDRLVGAVIRGIHHAAQPLPTAARTAPARPRFSGAGRGRADAQTDAVWTPVAASRIPWASPPTRRRTNSS